MSRVIFSMETLRGAVIDGSSLAFAATGCSEGSKQSPEAVGTNTPKLESTTSFVVGSTVSVAPETTTTTALTTPSASGGDVCNKPISAYTGKAELIFDYRDGNSKIIQVYPCVDQQLSSKQYSGTFTDGDVVTAICQTTGRRVPVQPGERGYSDTPYSSNIWYRLDDKNSTYFATKTYVKDTPQLDALPEC